MTSIKKLLHNDSKQKLLLLYNLIVSIAIFILILSKKVECLEDVTGLLYMYQSDAITSD